MTNDHETTSTTGPTCPACGHMITPDEGKYYDEYRYTEDQCDQCGKAFKVKVSITTEWECSLVPDGDL